MKLYFVVLDLTLVGGIERVISILSNEFVDLGYDVEIVSVFCKNGKPFYPISPKVTVNYLSLGEYLLDSFAGKIISHYRLIKLLRRFLNGRKNSIFIGASANVNFYLGIFSNKKSLVVASEHAQYFAFGLLPRLLRIFAYKFGVQVIVSLNQTDAKFYQSWHSRVICIPNPLNIQPLRSSNSVPFRILTIGRMELVKGHDRLLRIFSTVINKLHLAELTIVGNGSQRAKLIDMIAKLGLSNKVILAPFSNNISEHFENSSIFVLPSYQECFPMVLLEAMSAGLVPVSFDCPSGPRDIIEDGISGFLVPNNDEVAFSEAIVKLANDENLRVKMELAARKRALLFAAPLIAKRWSLEVFSLFK